MNCGRPKNRYATNAKVIWLTGGVSFVQVPNNQAIAAFGCGGRSNTGDIAIGSFG